MSLPTPPRHAKATPLPTFAGGGRQAGSQGDDDGERGRQIPLRPCHGLAGPPAAGWGQLGLSWHLFASERPELQHTAAHAQALCAHCSHPHRRAARRGGRSLPVTARKPMGWVGSAASPPSCSTRTRCTQPEHPKCRLRSPAILFSSLPHHAVLAAEQPLRCSCSPSLFSAPVLLLSEPNRQPAPWPSAAAAPCPGPACRMVAPASSPRPWGQRGEALRFLPPRPAKWDACAWL